MWTAWDELMQSATAFRHALHQHPELPWQEQETARSIRRELDRAGIRWRACAGTGTVATLAADAQGRHVALRSDIDALPITEALDVPWASEVDGCMHACGHDGHAAALLATGLWLRRYESVLPGPVSLLFQPAEEGGHGAREMVAEGALDGVDVIFGWHNWPAIPLGQAVCPDGVVMAGNGTFHIQLTGRGGHASQPELCRDPVLAAAAVTVALQQIVSRRFAPQSSAVVSLTSIDARSNPTVIPDAVSLEGSIRIADMSHRDAINRSITEIVTSTAAAYGVGAQVEHRSRYNPTLNHPVPAAEMRDAIRGVLGAGWQAKTAVPIMASEDFSYYLEQIPGAFALIGGGEPGADNEPCHSPRYRFNDGLLPEVTRIYARLAGLDPGDDSG